MLFALEQCDFSFGKTQMVVDMNKAEMARYKALSVDIGTDKCLQCGCTCVCVCVCTCVCVCVHVIVWVYM